MVVAGAPLIGVLEVDGGLDHLERRRVGGGLGPADLAEDMLHLREGADDAVGLLQDFLALVIDRPGKVVGM